MAEALYASEPKSEWRVFDGANAVAGQRFVATPSAVADAAGAALVPEPHLAVQAIEPRDPTEEPARQPSTQVLLRIHADADEPELLLDGRPSVADPATGVHALPAFRIEELVTEDGSGRRMPAPVVVGCLVEEGARIPQVVKVQVVQRTFVDGVQVDAGVEAVVAEAELEPFVAGDTRARVLAVAYPARFTKEPYVTIVDKYKVRTREAGEQRALITAFTRLMETVTGSRTNTVYTRIQDLLNQFTWRRAIAVLSTIVSLYFIGIAATGVGLAGNVLLGRALFLSGSHDLINSIYQMVVGGPNMRKPDDWLSVDVDIPISKLPELIKHIVGYNTAGDSSNSGRPWTYNQLRKNNRVVDAVVLEYFQYLPDEPVNAARLQAGLLAMAQARLGQAWTDGIRAEIVRDFRAFMALFEARQSQNLLELHGLQTKTLESNGYVEFDLRVFSVDDDVPHTLTMRSSTAARAGWYASGSADAFDAFQASVREVREAMDNAAFPLHRSPVVHGRVTGDLGTDVVNYLAGYKRTELQTTVVDFRRHLDRFTDRVVEAMQVPGEGAAQEPVNAIVPAGRAVRLPAPRLIRLLPHRVVRVRALVPTARLRRDGSVDYAQPSAPLTRVQDGVGEAVSACNASAAAARSTIEQFFECDGTARPRIRMHKRFLAPAAGALTLNVGRVRRLPDIGAVGAGDALAVRTRNLYAARQPFDVVEAIETYGQHERIGERTRVEWLTRPVGGDADKRGKADTASWSTLLGVGASHTDELVAGAFFDLVCTDIVARHGASRAAVVSSPEAFAAEQLVAAGRLAKEAFDFGTSPPTRIADDDAFYECYPGGLALRSALRESPSWRRWGRPTPDYAGATRPDRLVRAHTEGTSTPQHYDALASALKRGGVKRQPPGGRSVAMPYERAPYMSVQTLVVGQRLDGDGVFGSALSQAEAAWSALARVRALCVALAPLGVTPPRRTSALVDAAAARPILEIAGPVAALAGAPPELVRLLAKPLDAPSAEVQPQIADDVADGHRRWAPASLVAPAVRAGLRHRLASMRLDLEAVAQEPVGQELVERMRHCTVADDANEVDNACTLLVPFAAGEPPALQPDLCNAYAFDQTPIFTAALLGRLEALERDHAVLVGTPPPVAASCTIACYEVSEARRRSKHPMQIATSRDPIAGGATVEVAVVLSTRGSQRIPADGTALTAAELGANTLSDVLALVQGNSQTGRAEYVDAANALMWTIERLVQAIYVALSAFDGIEAIYVQPPPPPAVRLERVPAPPDEPGTIAAAQHQQLVMVALMALNMDMARRVDFGDAVRIDDAVFRMDRVIWEGEDVEDTEAATDARPVPTTPLPADEARDRLEAMTDAEIRIGITERGSSIADVTAAAANQVNNYAGRILSITRLGRLTILYETYLFYTNRLAALQRKHDQATADATASAADATRRNDAAVAAAAARYDAALRAWPLIVATASTVVAENAVIAVPLVDTAQAAAPPAVGRLDASKRAVAAARAAGVKAVPLCEWTAVLARTREAGS
jgi:hypothetical protein